ncbi:hypothetical protein, partial [Flavobacterium psychrophilum]|uniref:hypothetical protein n=1 Tax=Flavobacterium psychrophilum TaxID=96345 RepID=UPI001D060AA0
MRFLLRRNDKTKQNKTQTLSFRGIFVIPTREESHQVNAKQNTNFVFPTQEETHKVRHKK